jgi:hypothetical protein
MIWWWWWWRGSALCVRNPRSRKGGNCKTLPPQIKEKIIHSKFELQEDRWSKACLQSRSQVRFLYMMMYVQ